jgi:alpha-1,2-mannosyltransferase
MHSLLSRAAVGLHTMWNEHFGISIVEMMAAGLVVVAHKSGGPLMDIVTSCIDPNSRLGYLAESAEEYADCISKALDTYSTEASELMRIRARQHIKKFSDEEFAMKIIKIFNTII